MDKYDKWLYFRTVADEDNEDGTDDVLCVPASSMVNIAPTSDTTLTMTFKSVHNTHKGGTVDNIPHDTVVLTVNQGKTFEAMAGVVQAINSYGRNDDGFIVIADDATVAFGGAAGSLSTSYIHRAITACGAITLADANSSTTGLRFPSVGMGNAAPTAISATELSVNTHYKGSVATNLAMTIPSAAAGKIGDWITVTYNGVINNGQAHTYTTTTDTAYTLGSLIRVKAGADDNDSTRPAVVDIAVAADNVITLTGLTDGDGGIGTVLRFVNMTGAAQGWAVDCVVEGQGKQNAASTAAFS